MTIKKVCDCGSFNTDIFSAKEKIVTIQEKKIPVVEINYICNDCGSMDTETPYLYKDKIKD